MKESRAKGQALNHCPHSPKPVRLQSPCGTITPILPETYLISPSTKSTRTQP